MSPLVAGGGGGGFYSEKKPPAVGWETRPVGTGWRSLENGGVPGTGFMLSLAHRKSTNTLHVG